MIQVFSLSHSLKRDPCGERSYKQEKFRTRINLKDAYVAVPIHQQMPLISTILLEGIMSRGGRKHSQEPLKLFTQN